MPRVDTPEFELLNKAQSREPIFVVEIAFDFANTDLHYLTSQSVVGLTGNIINETLQFVSSTSQKIDYIKALSTIGTIRFQCTDEGLTTLQRSKLDVDRALTGKRVRVYQGYRGMPWADYQLIQTQIVDASITYKDNIYTFQCADIQRAMRQTIFEPKETVLTASITATQESIPVLDTSQFELVYQVPSTSGKTLWRGIQQAGDHPNYKASYDSIDNICVIKIENDDDYELAIATSKTASSFDGLIRGVLGTNALDVEVQSGATDQNAPRVTEVIYIDMPAVKTAYALLTGSIYGSPGEFLPNHWHMGISTDYIQTSSFVNIGADLWDTTDDDKGFPAYIFDPESEDAKKFIEQNIYFMLGVYSPILNTGELSLRKIKPIAGEGAYDRLLNETNVVRYSELNFDLSQITNFFILRWNWDTRRNTFTRVNTVIDTTSETRHGLSKPRVIELRTLHGSRNSDFQIRHLFDVWRSRYAGPPIILTMTLTQDQNDLEVGDIVRVQLPQIEDFTSEAATTLDRNFEIQSISYDWVRGTVQVSLFGSSARADDIAPTETETVNPDFIDENGTAPAGNEINATNFPGAVSSAAGVTTVTGNITLTGNVDANDPSCIYYCNEELLIDASATVTFTNNVQIRVNGFMTVNGILDGEGQGYAGGVADTTYSHLETPVAANLGTAAVGRTMAQGGYDVAKTSFFGGFEIFEVFEKGHAARIIAPDKPTHERPMLSVNDDGTLAGLPSTLMGSSGSSGGGVDWNNNNTINAIGGNGGAGGAGIAIFSAGFGFGVNGEIRTSGTNGSAGALQSVDGQNMLAAGAGAGGAPGGVIIGILDSAQSWPIKSSVNFKLIHGNSPEAAKTFRRDKYVVFLDEPQNDVFPYSSSAGGGGSLKQAENTYVQNSHILFLDTRSTAVPDEPPFVETDPTFTLTEYRATPTPEESTIEVSVTPPSVDNYRYAIAEYRRSGETGWTEAGAASNEALFVVPSDGATYEVRVRAVSNQRNVSASGPIQSITVTAINGRTNAELSALYPFDAITVALDSAGATFSGDGVGFTWGDSNRAYDYFNYYRVEIYNGATLLRTENINDPQYGYPAWKNAEDYFSQNGSNGAYPEVEIRVYPVATFNNSSAELYTGTAGTLTATAVANIAPTPTLSFTEVGEALLSWDDTNTEYFTTTFLLEYDGSIIAQTTDNQMIVPVSWTGSRTFTFYASVIAGQLSTGLEVIVSPNAPGQPTVTQRVIDNNVLFTYSSAKGSLPIERYEIRRAATYNVGDTPIATKAGTSTFTVIAETISGTYTYWFDAIDIAGNRSATRQISAIVNEPPDYNFVDSYSAEENNWPGTLTNCLVDIDNRLILPVNTTETWAQHFTNNSWDQPQDQIDASYDYYLQPSTNTATYQFEWDTGAVISSTMISCSPAPNVFDGSVTHSTEIEYRETTGDSWTSGGAGVEQILATDFRYVRVTISFTASGGDDLAYLNDVLIRLDAKIARDSGKGTALASDTNGTEFFFNKNFVDAEPPRISINTNGGAAVAKHATVDFVDAANPTSFKVYIWNTTGGRVDADISWETSGFLGS